MRKHESEQDKAGATPVPISFADPVVHQCPYPSYDTLRKEAPVYRDPLTGNFVLTRYADIRKAVLTPKTLSNKTGLGQSRETNATEATNAIYDQKGWRPLDTMLSNDPPSHAFYRRLVDKAFTPPKVMEMEPRIDKIVDELIARFIDKPEIDFVEEFATKLPMYVIAQELSIDRRDMPQLKVFSDASIESQDPTMTYERELEVATLITEMQCYMAASVERLRKEPDGMLLSRLVHAEIDGRHLDMRELMSILQQLIVGGTDTTTTTLAGGMRLLIENPDKAAELRSNADLMRNFVEEALRLSSPIQTMFRRAVEDIEIHGVAIPKGSIIEVRFGSANRDPAVYAEPACLDLQRVNSGSHLAFGAGPHICIGNQLARGELRRGFKGVIERMGNFRASRGKDSYAHTHLYVSNGLTTLWMHFDKR